MAVEYVALTLLQAVQLLASDGLGLPARLQSAYECFLHKLQDDDFPHGPPPTIITVYRKVRGAGPSGGTAELSLNVTPREEFQALMRVFREHNRGEIPIEVAKDLAERLVRFSHDIAKFSAVEQWLGQHSSSVP